MKVWTYHALVTWHDYPGRVGAFHNTIIAPRWKWLAMKMVEARLSWKAKEGMEISGVTMS